MGLMKIIKRWLCCGGRKDDVQEIYDKISQYDEDIWSETI